jgi:hypothetical protein
MQHDGQKHDFAGMTPNERLFATGLLPQWDACAARRDRLGMIALLCKVEFSEQEAARSVDQILSHPEVYLRNLRPAT